MESVWDYPRPPALEPERRRVRVVHDGVTIADSTRALRVLETSHPPAIYVPPERRRHRAPHTLGGARDGLRVEGPRDVLGPRRRPRGGVVVRGAGGEVRATSATTSPSTPPAWTRASSATRRSPRSPSDFYGGWITADVAGPFKGPPGTLAGSALVLAAVDDGEARLAHRPRRVPRVAGDVARRTARCRDRPRRCGRAPRTRRRSCAGCRRRGARRWAGGCSWPCPEVSYPSERAVHERDDVVDDLVLVRLVEALVARRPRRPSPRSACPGRARSPRA